MSEYLVFFKNIIYNATWVLENFIQSEKLKKIRRDHQLLLIEKYKNKTPEKLQFKEFNKISKKEFTKLYKSYEPFVIRGGAKNWDCVKKWNFEYFSKEYGDFELPFFEEENGDQPIYQDVKIKDAIKGFKEGIKKYCKFADVLYRIPKLKEDVFIEELDYLKPSISQKGNIQFFLGPDSSTTRLHNAIGNNFFVQVYGEKTWKIYPIKHTNLFSPKITKTSHYIGSDEFAFPHEHKDIGNNISYWEIPLKAGDILFNPSYMWHTVENHSDSIALRCSWTSFRSLFRHPIMTFLTIISLGRDKYNLKKGNHMRWKVN
jgi:hypothetical protein